MEIIVQWITQIIIFILLASIIDLFIPATSMRKYIKLVIGLILMLIFLKPVFYIFNMDMQSALETSVNELYQEEEGTDSVESLIEMKKTEIQASQDAYILEQMEIQLIEIAKAALLREHQTEIVMIDFLFTNGQSVTYENLEEVIVYLRETDEREGAMDVVDEVLINTEDSGMEHKIDDEEIKSLLQKVWEFNNQELTIKWGGGSF